MRNQLRTIIAIVISAVILISCQPNTVSTPSVENGNIQDIRVQIVEPVRTTSEVEQFSLPNCGGTDKLTQSLGTFASVSKSATVGTKAFVTGGGEVAVPETVKLKLEIQVGRAYQQTFESANSRLDTIVMSAAAGTHVVYTIVWEKQTFNSIVQYSSDSKVYEVPYTYVLSVPKIDKSYNVICDGSNAGNNQPPDTQPTIAQVATQSGNLIHNEPVSPEALARIVGGDAAYWKQAGPVVWVYSNKGHNTLMRHPGDNMILTYWAGFGDPQNADGCQIIVPPADNLAKYVKCPSGTNAQIVADQVGLHLIDYTGYFP